MKRIYFFTALTVLLLPTISNAQYTIGKDDHTLEIGGDMIMGYNYRFYPTGTTDFHKDNFDLDEARLSFQGRINLNMEWYVRVDFADFVADIQTPTPAIGGLKEAYLIYKMSPFYMKAGYQKVPFSFSSLTEEYADPFLQRPIVADDEITSRRDLGVTLYRFYPEFGVTWYAGLYSGMGEEVFSTDNTTAVPEYAVRLEYAYPAKYSREFIDWRNSPVPVFQFGAGIRHADDGVTGGGDYGYMTVDGPKTVYGADASVMYKGLSLQVESDQMTTTPYDNTQLLTGDGVVYPSFKAGGYYVELNYLSKPLKSVFAVRFDEFTPTNLAYDNYQRTMSFAYNYNIRENYMCVKIAYEYRLDQPYPAGTIWKDSDIRAMFQVRFN